MLLILIRPFNFHPESANIPRRKKRAFVHFPSFLSIFSNAEKSRVFFAVPLVSKMELAIPLLFPVPKFILVFSSRGSHKSASSINKRLIVEINLRRIKWNIRWHCSDGVGVAQRRCSQIYFQGLLSKIFSRIVFIVGLINQMVRNEKLIIFRFVLSWTQKKCRI